MQLTNKYFNIEVRPLIDFIAKSCQQTGFFEGAFITGSLVHKKQISCVNDIDLVLTSKKENLESARDFLEGFKVLLLNHLDYCLLEENSIGPLSKHNPKFGLIWTSYYLRQNLFGAINLNALQATQDDFHLYQETKIKETQYFKLSTDFKVTDIFPIVHGYFSLNIAKKFLAIYAYQKTKGKPSYFDKERLLQDFEPENQIEKIIFDEFLFFYTNGELVESTPLTQVRLGKLAYLIQDLYSGFINE